MMVGVIQPLDNDLMAQPLFSRLFHNNSKAQWLVKNLIVYNFNTLIPQSLTATTQGLNN